MTQDIEKEAAAHGGSDGDDPANDLVWGGADIGKEINRTARQVHHSRRGLRARPFRKAK